MMPIEDVAILDMEKVRLESTRNVLARLDVDEDDRIHVDKVINVLQAKIDRIDEALREGETQ